MYSILIVIIYIAFISLGLPDSLVGAGWPVMHRDLGVPTAYAGIITMTISAGTILSSLFSDKINRRLGTGLVTAISVMMTAVALFGFSISGEFWMLVLWSVPYGLGAGAVDAALNNYVALHYASRHMSWLHCFWGVGASVSPYIMSFCLTGGYGWHAGYLAVSMIQITLTVALFMSLPLWKGKATQVEESAKGAPMKLKDVLKIKGVWQVLVTFFAYCALEQTAGVWASSYLVENRAVNEVTAAKCASLFYLGITFGRFLCGFVADKFGDRKMIRMGIYTALSGSVMILIPMQMEMTALAGLIIVGVGCAPIYPSVIHSTPDNFGEDNSQAIIGIQMASAYVGSTFMPPLFGWVASVADVALYPVFLLIFGVLMLVMSERLNKLKAQDVA